MINIAQAQTFTSTVNQDIPDAGPVVSFPLDIGGLPNTIDTSFGLEKVCIDMTHTWDGDMAVWIQAPDGTTKLLFQGVGWDGDNFTNTCLRGDGLSIAYGAAPFTGEYAAMGLIGSVNNGQNPNGTWNLLCQDQWGQDVGFLVSWSITFSNDPATVVMFDSTRLPIVIMNTDGVDVPDAYKIHSTFKIIDNGPGQWNHTSQTDYAYDGQIMVELQGFSGPWYPKKNYDINVVDSDEMNIDASLLGMPADNDWILKAEYLDLSLMKNSVSYAMSRRMGRYAPRTMYCEVFLNDEYIGVYSLTEKVKRDSNRVDIAKLTPADTTGADLTGGYIFEMNITGAPAAWYSAYLPINSATCAWPVEFKHVYPKASVIQPQQHDYIKSFVDSFENVLASPGFQDPDTGFRKFAGAGSFVDFLIVNEFSANYDSYGRSTYMYKEKVTDGNKLHIGPPWDYDRAFAPGSEAGWVHEITHPYWPFPFWWSKFRQDSVFMRDLHCRWHSLRQTTLSDDSFIQYVDSVSNYIHEAAVRNFQRWPELLVTDYDAQVTAFKNFIITRNAWVDAALPDSDFVAPAIDLVDVEICEGDTVSALQQNSFMFEYLWSDGSTTSNIPINSGGVYSVTLSSVYGCPAASDQFVATVLTLPDASFTWSSLGNNVFEFHPTLNNAAGYLWDFGNGNFSTLENPTTLLYDSVNSVTLTVTGANGCSSTFTNSITPFNSIATVASNAIHVYPNPAYEIISINTSNTNVERIEIINVEGKVAHASTFSNSVSIQTLPKGIYELRLFSKNDTSTGSIQALVGKSRFVKM